MRRLVRNEAGFVFMDLTFLVLILFVLALLLLPALAAAREKARRTACFNNLQQLSMALESYCGDYSGYFPCKPAYGAASVTYDAAKITSSIPHIPDMKLKLFECSGGKAREERVKCV